MTLYHRRAHRRADAQALDVAELEHGLTTRAGNEATTMPEPAKPYPKAAQLARGERRYRRKIASPKQWQAIQAEKLGPCRLCGAVGSNGRLYGKIQLHHLVARDHFGDDVADNIVPLCQDCHSRVTNRVRYECRGLMYSLSDAEYAYMVARGGPDYPQRGYGVEYAR